MERLVTLSRTNGMNFSALHVYTYLNSEYIYETKYANKRHFLQYKVKIRTV